jgi:uncharacterized repeat protein (TIGR03847 family)
MTQNIFLFDPVERFVVGTVGQPGERSFYIQARTGSRLLSVLVEKDQVAALAGRLALLLRELKRTDEDFSYSPLPRDDSPLETPIDEEFRVGTIAIAWMGDRNMVSLELSALVVGQEEVLEIEDSDDDVDSDVLHVLLTPAQTDQFISRANAVVNAGRPPCPFCGLALDPRGHVCPRANGYRR